MKRNPDINDDDIGAFTFKLQKEQAVERVIGKIRYHLGRNWVRFRDDEIQLLEKVLGECWAVSDFQEWEAINFAAITYDHVYQIIDLARQMNKGKKPPHVCYIEVRELLHGL